MLKGLMGASIWSEDHTRLLPFYRDVLGLGIAYSPEGFVAFGEPAEGGGYVGAYLGLGTHGEVRGAASEPFRHMVGLESDDVDGDYERLLAAGVEFVEPPTTYGEIRIATLKDPEGNIVQLLQVVGG